MLSLKNRLKKKKDFEWVFKKGKSFRDGFLSLRLVENNLKTSRFAFVVSLKVSKKATLRNKLKRGLKKTIKANLPRIKTGFDVMLTAIPGLEKQSQEQIKETTEIVLKKAELI